MIKERIKDFEQCISFLKLIRDNIYDTYIEIITSILIEKLIELKEIFILSITYSEVN